MQISKTMAIMQPSYGRLKIHPTLGIAALTTHQEAGFGIWTLARSLDLVGRGFIEPKLIQKFMAILLGVSCRLCKRWLANAINAGLVGPLRLKKSRACMLRICSLLKAAKRFGVTRLAGAPVYIPIDALRSIGIWRAHLWAAYLTSFRCRPISRETLERLTGVPQNSQRAYERLPGVQVIPNYAISDTYATPEMIQGIRQHTHPGAFPIALKRYGKTRTVVAWQLPNTYQTKLEIARRGQQRKVNRLVGAHHDALLDIGGGKHAHGERQRLFYPNARDAAKAARRNRTKSHSDVEYYYLKRPRTKDKRKLWGVLK